MVNCLLPLLLIVRNIFSTLYCTFTDTFVVRPLGRSKPLSRSSKKTTYFLRQLMRISLSCGQHFASALAIALTQWPPPSSCANPPTHYEGGRQHHGGIMVNTTPSRKRSTRSIKRARKSRSAPARTAFIKPSSVERGRRGGRRREKRKGKSNR